MKISKFTPAQQQAFVWLLGAIPTEDVLVLRGPAGAGKTSVLERVRVERGGVLVSLKAQVTEDKTLHVIERALERADLILVDNLHEVNRRNVSDSYLFDASLTAILAEAAAAHKTLVFGTEGETPWPILRRACLGEIAA